MINDIKIMLGDAAPNFSDAQINLAYKQALTEVEAYCNREADIELDMIADRLAVIKLNRMNTEGLSGQSFSGASESYIDGYPADILAILNRKRKIKIL
jgi:hypothetical protein